MTNDVQKNLRRIRENWQRYNLAYDTLQQHLVTVKKTYGLKKSMSTRLLVGETRTFAEILDADVEKMVLFYLRTQGDLADRLWKLREYQTTHMQNSFRLTMESIETMCQKYRDLGQDVLDLLEYLDQNVIALRRIIKKHDKHFDLQMGKVYFGARLGKTNSQLVQLYHQEGLYAIIGTIRRGFEDLYEMKYQLEHDMREEDGDEARYLSVSERRHSGLYIDSDKGGDVMRRRGSSITAASLAASPATANNRSRRTSRTGAMTGHSAHALTGRQRFSSSTALHAMLLQQQSLDHSHGSHHSGLDNYHPPKGSLNSGAPGDLARNLSTTLLNLLPQVFRSKGNAGTGTSNALNNSAKSASTVSHRVDAERLLLLEPMLHKIDEASLKVGLGLGPESISREIFPLDTLYQ